MINCIINVLDEKFVLDRLDKLNQICIKNNLKPINCSIEQLDDNKWENINYEVPNEVNIGNGYFLTGICIINSDKNIRIIGDCNIGWNSVEKFYYKYGKVTVYRITDCKRFLFLTIPSFEIKKYASKDFHQLLYEKMHDREYLLGYVATCKKCGHKIGFKEWYIDKAWTYYNNGIHCIKCEKNL